MFTQRFLAALVATASVFVCGSQALVARSPSSAASVAPVKVSYTTYTPLASDFPDVSRDWPAGGSFGGRTLMIYSDTQVNRPDMVSFTSNSYAYVNNINEPTEVQDVGGSNEFPTYAIPWGEGECVISKTLTEADCTPWNLLAHGGWYIWPSAGLVTQYNDPTATEAYAIAGVGLRSPETRQYSTLIHWTSTSTGVNATRPVQKYITLDSEHEWGWSMASHTDGKVRIFATKGILDPANPNDKNNQSLYIAEVAWDTITDRSTFQYWDGTNYQDDESSAAVIATGDLSSGDIWWCEVCNTWILAYMGGAGIGSPCSAVFDPPFGTDYNYGGHAYPQFFGTNGQEVLLSWTYRWNTTNLPNAMLTQMAKLTFSV